MSEGQWQPTPDDPESPNPDPKPRTTAPKEPSTQEALQGLLQLPAAGLIISGQRSKNIALVADGATILVHGPGLAAAIAEIAENDPRVMALLEKVITFGPYGGLLTILFQVTAQIARNHGAPEELTSMGGAVSPEDIISAGGLDPSALIVVPEPSDNGQRQDADSPNI